MRRRLPWLGLLSVFACGGDPATGDLLGECASLVDTCLVEQNACVVDDGAPRCVACGPGTYAPHDRQGCQPIGGTALSHDFPDNTTEPGGELRGLCRSWTLDNPEPLYVNAVELEQDEISHHSNWMFVPDDRFDGPDGIWPCADRSYSQTEAALAGGVLYAQSTQAVHEVQKFPDGVVVKLPAKARIISDIHTLNTTSQAVTGNAKLTIYSIPPEEVSLVLTPFHVDYHGLDIPPQSDSRFTGVCNLEDRYRALGADRFELAVYYMLPHTHALGTRMFVEAYGGSHGDGTTIIDVRGFNGEARGRSFFPPLDVGGAEGLRFGCEFHNPRPENVVWGFDDQEMCEALGFAATPFVFESRIDEAVEDGVDGNILKFTGDCSSLVLPWEGKD